MRANIFHVARVFLIDAKSSKRYVKEILPVEFPAKHCFSNLSIFLKRDAILFQIIKNYKLSIYNLVGLSN